MAISRDKKETLVTELTDLFEQSKLAVGAVYSGLGVGDLQELRAMAREAGVTIKVSKNRLVRVALSNSTKHKQAETSGLTGQLLYAFSSEDEVAPAQVLARFAKKHADLKLAIGFDDTGSMLDAVVVNELANLPTKDQLRGQLVSVFSSPLSGLLNSLNGTQRGLTQVLSQRAESL